MLVETTEHGGDLGKMGAPYRGLGPLDTATLTFLQI